jgi:hypothetical protein
MPERLAPGIAADAAAGGWSVEPDPAGVAPKASDCTSETSPTCKERAARAYSRICSAVYAATGWSPPIVPLNELLPHSHALEAISGEDTPPAIGAIARDIL